MLREALTYPLRADEETLLVGAILAVAAGVLARLGPLAILALAPVVLLAGYALAVLRESAGAAGGAPAAGEAPPSPPRFPGVRALACDGVRALAVAVGYLLVPAGALAVTVGGALAGGRPADVATSTVVFGAGTVVLALVAAFAYLAPAALVGVARTGRLRAAIQPARLRRVAGRVRYFLACVGALAVSGVAVLLLGMLGSLGRPGEVVALAGGFYALVAVARLLGRGAA